MIEFVEKPEEEIDPFEEYYTNNIIPLVDEENKIKARYHSKFWGYLFSVLFIMSANVLVVLFISLMHKTPISWSQLFLINAIALALVYWPVYSYKKLPKNDIFDVFLRFYGNWQHLKNSEVKLVHSPIIPEHDAVGATHNVVGKFENITIEMRDTYYKKKNKIVSQGVILYATFNKKFNGSLLMFEKNGFYRKNKFPDYELYNGKTDIPSANYFNIFTSNDEIGENLLHNLFFENLLDLKDVFKAHRLYLQSEDNYMRIYLEGSSMYIDNYKFWSRKIDKNRFLQMHKEFEKMALFFQTVESLMDEK
ncbi:MAG: DUF3137 domain-containing protein [Alphaproteobacteria bacterium]|nr:DUF3137 domain-containing protein [Alphaproteobacteria bacterium]